MGRALRVGLAALWATAGLSGCSEALAADSPSPARSEANPTSQEASLAEPSVLAWQFKDPGLSWRGNTMSTRIARDGAGNVVTLSSYRRASGRTLEMIKLNPSGQVLWRKAFGWEPGFSSADSDFYSFPDLAVDAAGNILVAGHGPKTMDLGDGALGKGSFLAKFSPGGALLWRKALCDELGIRAVAVDSQGAVWFGGQVGPGCNVGGGVRWLVDAPAFQGYMAKFDANGESVFDRAIGGKGDIIEVMDMATTADDGIVVAGWRYDYGNATRRESFVSKFAKNGPHRWYRGYPETDGGFYGVAAMGNDVVAAGSFVGTMRFGGRDYTAASIFGAGNVAVYGQDGEERWMGMEGQWLKEVAVGPLGIAVVGTCGSSGSSCPAPDRNFGGVDGRLTLFSTSGTRMWSAGFGPFHYTVWEVAYHPTGEVSLSGAVDISPSDPPTASMSVIRLRPL